MKRKLLKDVLKKTKTKVIVCGYNYAWETDIITTEQAKTTCKDYLNFEVSETYNCKDDLDIETYGDKYTRLCVND